MSCRVALLGTAVITALLVTSVAPSMSVAAVQPAAHRLVVPGEGIGTVQLIERVSDLQQRFGAPTRRQVWPSLQTTLNHDWSAEYYLQARFGSMLSSGPGSLLGLWDGTTLFEWREIGLSVTADVATGVLIWISVCACGANPWAESRTEEGLGFGATEDQVLAAMGRPSGVFADARGRSLWYAPKGIAFLIATEGPASGTLQAFRVFWKARLAGDSVVVPGQRIGTITVGMSLTQVRAELGDGHIVQQQKSSAIFYWPHIGLTTSISLGRVDQVAATLERHQADAGLRYLTVGRVGTGSRMEEVEQVLGRPAERIRGPADLWIYRSRGIAFAIGNTIHAGIVLGVNIFAPPWIRACPKPPGRASCDQELQ